MRIAKQDAPSEYLPDPVTDHRHLEKCRPQAAISIHVQPSGHEQEDARYALGMTPGESHDDRPSHGQANHTDRLDQAKAIKQVHQLLVVEVFVIRPFRAVRPTTPEMIILDDPETRLDQRLGILLENEARRRKAMHHDDHIALFRPTHLIVKLAVSRLQQCARRLGPRVGVHDFQVFAGPPIRAGHTCRDDAHRQQQNLCHTHIPLPPDRGTRQSCFINGSYQAKPAVFASRE